MTTAATGPASPASMPDSNSPSSFDIPMNRLFTADTRPRSESGVSSCASASRITTLTASHAPAANSIANERKKFLERPNTTMAIPNPVTALTRAAPERRNGGRWATMTDVVTAPNDCAARSQPSPDGSPGSCTTTSTFPPSATDFTAWSRMSEK